MLLLLINGFLKRKKLTDESFLPEITFIVPAFNEEEVIEEKVINSLAINYPADKISFVFITDGSTDRTADIVRAYSHIRLLHDEKRMGKSAAINKAWKHPALIRTFLFRSSFIEVEEVSVPKASCS